MSGEGEGWRSGGYEKIYLYVWLVVPRVTPTTHDISGIFYCKHAKYRLEKKPMAVGNVLIDWLGVLVGHGWSCTGWSCTGSQGQPSISAVFLFNFHPTVMQR